MSMVRPIARGVVRNNLGSIVRNLSGIPLPNVLAGASNAALYNISPQYVYEDAGLLTPASLNGVVGSVRDLWPYGNHLVRVADATRPVLKQRSDGVYWLDFSGGKTMRIDNSAAAFKFLHDGTGGTILAMLEYPQSEVASNFLTTCSSTSQAGIIVSKSAATQSGIATICRGVAGVAATSLVMTRLALSSALRFLRLSYKHNGGASDIKCSLDSSLTSTGAVTANAPSSADAFSNFTIPTTYNGKLYGLAVVGKEVIDAEAQQAYAYMRQQYQYAVPNVNLTLIIGGQSNASGRGTLAPTSEEAQVGVYVYDKAEEFKLGYEPSHSIENRPIATVPDEAGETTPQHSFALRTGKELLPYATTLLVPCAVGSTSMSQWAKPATKRDRTTLFGALDYRYAQASIKGGDPVFIWYGHESNANSVTANYTNGTINSTYQTAWATLVTDLRTEVADAPVIFCQLASDDTLSVAVANALAGEAQRQTELSVASSFMVVTHDLARNASTDDLHLSKAGQIALGSRLALAIRDSVLSGLGPEFALNGGFTADKKWTKGTGWTITNKLVGTGVTVGNAAVNQMSAVAGRTYRIEYDVTVTSGGMGVAIGSVNGEARTTAGTFTYIEYITASTTTALSVVRRSTDFTGEITRISCRERIDAAGSLANINGRGPRIVGATYAGAVVTLECDKAINTTAGNYGGLFRVYDNGVEATVSSAARNVDTAKIDITCSATLTGPICLTYGHVAGPASAARTDFVKDTDNLPLPVFGAIVVSAA